MMLQLLLAASLTVAGEHDLRIIDGDTLKYGNVVYRLYGIDAPEFDQPGSDAASRALKRLIDIYGIENLQFTTKGKDRYGRVLAIFGGVNCELVREGYVWAYLHYSRLCKKEELEARATKRGLWSKPGAIAPWVWRHYK